MIKIEIPEDRELAKFFGEALVAWSNNGNAAKSTEPQTEFAPEETTTEDVEFAEVEEEVEEELSEIELPIETPAYVSDVPPLDCNNVQYNPEYCEQTKVGSGPRKGQWKVRDGLRRAIFNEWYANELGLIKSEELTEKESKTAPKEKPPTNVTQSIFAPEPEPKAIKKKSNPNFIELSDKLISEKGTLFDLPEQVVEVQTRGPKDVADLMAWLAEYQAAHYLTSGQIQEAYREVGIEIRNLFPPTPDAEIADNIKKTFEVLKKYVKQDPRMEQLGV